MNDNRNSEPNNLNDYEMLEFFLLLRGEAEPLIGNDGMEIGF